MKTLSAKYKGNRILELNDLLDLPIDSKILVVIPEDDDEKTMHQQLRSVAEVAFAKLWHNKEDEVWREYHKFKYSSKLE